MNDFWSHVLVGAAKCEPLLPYSNYKGETTKEILPFIIDILCGPAKIAEFDIVIFVKEEVFGLDISVHHVIFVAMVDREAGLMKEPENLGIRQHFFTMVI